MIGKVLFHPSNEVAWTPQVKYHDYYVSWTNIENIGPKGNPDWFDETAQQSGPNYIHIWYFDHFKHNDVKTVLFFHGNAGNITHRDYIYDICQKFHLNLMLVDYRGFGKSSGQPSIKNIYEDGQLAYNSLLRRCSPDKIIIWGESLGGTVATKIAQDNKCSCLFLLSTFSSFSDAVEHTRLLSSPLKFFMLNMGLFLIDPMSTKEMISHVKYPVVILHSKEDELIPFECAQILYDHINHDQKLLIEIEGSHSSPEITKEQLVYMFTAAGLDTSFSTDKDINQITENLRTIGQRRLEPRVINRRKHRVAKNLDWNKCRN